VDRVGQVLQLASVKDDLKIKSEMSHRIDDLVERLAFAKDARKQLVEVREVDPVELLAFAMAAPNSIFA
jgi:hypothetical protein